MAQLMFGAADRGKHRHAGGFAWAKVLIRRPPANLCGCFSGFSQVAFALGRHLSPCRGHVLQPLLFGWNRRPRRQIATLFGDFPVFRHVDDVDSSCRSLHATPGKYGG
jgi:hypothetical protein